MVSDTLLKDRYQLGRFPLAHNGMGEVWRARDTRLDRPVIVKFLNGAMNPEVLRRFRREALLTARLEHPGVPAVYDLDVHAGRPYLVLQQIHGLTLTDLVAEHGPLPIPWVAAIGAQISSVLLAARKIGLVHRDIKPSNVMLDPHGAIKVLDFGLAAIHDDDRYSRITQSGQSLGTVGYMAPEQILGQPVDHRTDLYGLGATLFDLLTGRAPFDDATTTTTVRHQLSSTPPRPGQLRPEIPTTLDDLVYALLALGPEDRPATAESVYAVLAPLSDDLPPLPGVLDRNAEAVRAYAAIVGRVPQPARPPVSTDEQINVDGPQPAQEAERLYANGEFRAAARLWRRLADHHAGRHGDADPLVLDLRRRAARAHADLGEFDRARRQLSALRPDFIRAYGAEHATVRELGEEIERLGAPAPGPRHPPRSPSDAGSLNI